MAASAEAVPRLPDGPISRPPQAGTYQARLTLEIHGDWAVQLNLSGPLRDRVLTTLRFEPDKVSPARAAKTAPLHRH